MTGLVLLAATSAESEPSKVPFYIAGGLLVAMALVLSFLGVRSETFPRTKGVQLVVIGIAVILVAAAMSTAVITA
jgi:hypothetical protein